MDDIIDNVEAYILTLPNEKRPHWVSLFKVPSANELLIRVKTKSGAEGFGLATSIRIFHLLLMSLSRVYSMKSLVWTRLHRSLFTRNYLALHPAELRRKTVGGKRL